MSGSGKSRRIVTIWYILGLCGLILLARVLYRYGKPERVGEMPTWSPYTARIGSNEQEYWVTENTGVSAIHTCPVAGGPDRLLIQEDPRYRIGGIVTITDRDLFYCVGKRWQDRGGAGGSSGPLDFEGTFRAASGKPPAAHADGEKHRTLRQGRLTVVDQWRLRRLLLSGGAAEDVAEIGSGYPCIVGNYAYWIDAYLDDAVEVRSGNRYHLERTGHSALMVTPLKGGPSHCLATGLEQFTTLFAGTDGVYWTEPHVYPDRTRDLYHMRASDLKPQVIAGFTGQEGVTEYQGRLYWAVRDYIDGGPVYNGELLRFDSMRLDGSDLRTVFSRVQNGTRLILPPTLDRGRLYLALTDLPPPTIAPPEKWDPIRLCRIHPERADAVETVLTLPAEAMDLQFAGGFLYFMVSENQRGLWAELTDDTQAYETRRVLFRMPLRD